VGHEQLVRETWDALSHGDLRPLEASLAPDARWRAVEDGPWNCENRARIMEVIRTNLERGLGGEIEEVRDLGEQHTLIGIRRENQGADAWPLDDGVRYMVLTFHEGLVSEMKGCPDRAAALRYAGAAADA